VCCFSLLYIRFSETRRSSKLTPLPLLLRLASRFAKQWRHQLMKEHLGLMVPQGTHPEGEPHPTVRDISRADVASPRTDSPSSLVLFPARDAPFSPRAHRLPQLCRRSNRQRSAIRRFHRALDWSSQEEPRDLFEGSVHLSRDAPRFSRLILNFFDFSPRFSLPNRSSRQRHLLEEVLCESLRSLVSTT